jgi:nucleoside-diphosphate-sugar epimerase
MNQHLDIFITGASGYIGSAVARALIDRGHTVRGLARSDRAERIVRSTGAHPIRGDLADLDVIAEAASAGDGVVHTAATTGEDRAEIDRQAVNAMLTAMSGGVFVTTTGAPVTASSTTPVPESQMSPRGGFLDWLFDAEHRVSSADHVRGVVVRPPMVYGDGGGPVAALVCQARAEGVARYIDNGANRWSTVHVRDLAVAYCLLLESDLSGAYHAAESDPIDMRSLVTAIASIAGAEAVGWPLDEATATVGPLATTLARESVLDASKLRHGTSWRPVVGESIGGIVAALTCPTQGYTNNAQA